MSDRMRPIQFEKMLNWILKEWKQKGTIFGIHQNKFYKNNSNSYIEMFGENLTTPLGPAAGPNSQLAQNIVAAYLTGSRFIELKTVQILDGEDLPVEKPCIAAVDECYNVEWSTELRVEEAFDEYIKAWFILHVLMKEFNLSSNKDFMFNMSVGYDLKGIKSPKINGFIEGLKDASKTQIWDECMEGIRSHLDELQHFRDSDLLEISPNVCNSITLSTLHGCPPQEIERIVNYLLKEKKLHTFIKMNPTLLGEKFVRDTLTKMGYDYITLNAHHFVHDLQYDDGVAMLKRLKVLSNSLNLEVGVKLTNTLPVKILNKELPGEEMYMSGRSLFPLTIRLASKLAKEFDGNLQISYSGGADYFNVNKILETGIKPITFATTILKPGGYERIGQMAEKIEIQIKEISSKIDTEKLEKLALASLNNKHHLKELRPVSSRKLTSKLPLLNCEIAPCTKGCPINQQIPEYIALVGEEKYDEAFRIILNDNTAPSITGSICNHNCQYKCTRLDYDESVSIRNMKKLAANHAETEFIEALKPIELSSRKRVGIIGAGPAGISAAVFLRRNGLYVEVMDKRNKPYGMVEHVIPEFRISRKAIQKDFELAKKYGVVFKFGVNQNFTISELQKEYDYLILAIGTWVPTPINLKEGKEKTIDAISFLENYNKQNDNLSLGKHVAVVGGGDVAIDAARASKRVDGVETVSIVYRRTKEFMPASLEEIKLALSEGIEIKELLSPMSIVDGKMHCEEMILGSKDESGRRRSVPNGNMKTFDVDTVIVAAGEKLESDLLLKNGIKLSARNYPLVNSEGETSIPNVYVAGDMKKGPATIVNAIADGKLVAKAILEKEQITPDFEQFIGSIDKTTLYDRKGILSDPYQDKFEASRCLACNQICELCVDVCPNRANMMIEVNGKHQVIHLDALCNECGNCGVFCPHNGNPYKDKFTVFTSLVDFMDSFNIGFVLVGQGLCKVRNEYKEVVDYKLGDKNVLSKDIETMIEACVNNYDYILS